MHQHETPTHHSPFVARNSFVALAMENNTTTRQISAAGCEDTRMVLANNRTLYVNMRLVIVAIHLFVFVHILTLFQVSHAEAN